MTLNANLDALGAQFRAAGLDVVDDPRDLQPPGVLVGMPDTLTPGPCGLTGTVAVWVLTAPPGNLDARVDLLDRLTIAAGAVVWTRADAGTYFPESGGPGMPGYRLTCPIYS